MFDGLLKWIKGIGMLQGKNYIAGEFHDLGPYFDKTNPCNQEVIGKFPQTGPHLVHQAYIEARDAFGKWKAVSRVKRGDYFYNVCQIIERRREELAKAISLETGKTYNESIAEVNEALHMSMYAFGSGRQPIGEAVCSEIADKDAYMLRKPKGVVAIVSPFNFPVAIGAFWCAAPAIVEGNTVILKPSEDTPYTSQLCAEIYDEAGFPEGVFNVIHGDGEVGDALINEDVDHICFTGSAEVGMHVRKVAAKSWHKTTSCEMGSKSACIVFDDANLDLSMEACVASAFKLSGQRCVSSGRFIVQRKIYNDFIKLFLERLDGVKCGPPFKAVPRSTGMPEAVAWDEYVPDESVTYGPLINQQGVDKVIMYNDMVRKDSEAEVLMDGGCYNGGDRGNGNFMSPFVYKSEWRHVPYLTREVFGPHVAIVPFDKTEDAVRIYNDTEYGLAVGILTDDFRKARYCRDNCDFGMCYWNGGSIAAESHLAFGGVKKSGNGFPSAARTFRAVTHEVSWTVNHAGSLEFPQGMK
jgi:aldehyde dehydrogenase (NAD+)